MDALELQGAADFGAITRRLTACHTSTPEIGLVTSRGRRDCASLPKGHVQRREKLGFPLESREPLFVFRELFRKDFDRNVAIELRISSAVDLARYSQIVLKHKNIFNRSKDDLAPCGKVEK